jgi:hypothetical protein
VHIPWARLSSVKWGGLIANVGLSDLTAYCPVGAGAAMWQDLGHEHDIQRLRWLLFSSRDHQPSRLAVSLLQPERREGELILAARDIVVSDETIRE